MSSAVLPIVGGCLCGAVRYEISQAPQKGAYCHCDACKKSYGGLFMASVQFEAASLVFVKGAPKFYRSSNIARRGFCSECGSPLVFAFDGDIEIWVLLGSLDEPDAWPLTGDATWGLIAHTQTDRMVSWHTPVAGLPLWTSKAARFQQEALSRAAASTAMHQKDQED